MLGYYQMFYGGFLLLVSLTSCVTRNTSKILSAEENPALKGLWPRIEETDVLIIGELHDNPYHHRLQGEIIAKIAQKKRLGAVLFEQLDARQEPQLKGLTSGDLNRLPSLIQWDQSGWHDFELYRPVFAAALEAGVPILAANFPQEKTREIYQRGLEALFSAEDLKASGLKTAFSGEILAALRDDIYEGHCRMMPRDHTDKMIPIQRARDAHMALALRKAPQSKIAVYIVGNGHARKDFGIPWYLGQMNPRLKVVSIGLLEESASDPNPTPQVYDFTLLTPAATRQDPCEELARNLRQAPKHSKP